MAVIPTIIGQRNFEVIRDQIAAILTDELNQQRTLLSEVTGDDRDQDLINYLGDLDIITERYAEPSEEDFPFVDVFFFNDDFDNKDPFAKRGTTQYIIDVFSIGEKQTPTGSEGGVVSATRGQRVAGMIDSILEFPHYNKLLQPNGVVNRTLVRSIKRTEEENSRDSINIILYRVIFEVVMGESVGSLTGPLAQNNITNVSIGESDLGYVWEFIED